MILVFDQIDVEYIPSDNINLKGLSSEALYPIVRLINNFL